MDSGNKLFSSCEKFFDYLNERYRDPRMLRYINMAALRTDFVREICLSIKKYEKNLEVDSYEEFTENIPFLLDLSPAEESEITDTIREFIVTMAHGEDFEYEGENVYTDEEDE